MVRTHSSDVIGAAGGHVPGDSITVISIEGRGRVGGRACRVGWRRLVRVVAALPAGRKPRLPGLECPKARTVSFDTPCQRMQTIADGHLRLGKIGLGRASAKICSCVAPAASMIVLPSRITSSSLPGCCALDEVRARRRAHLIHPRGKSAASSPRYRRISRRWRLIRTSLPSKRPCSSDCNLNCPPGIDAGYSSESGSMHLFPVALSSRLAGFRGNFQACPPRMRSALCRYGAPIALQP